VTTALDPQFEALLQYLKEARGFDFTGYKRSSLMRRVGRRMSQINVPDHTEYLDYLQVHPEEFTALFNTILINVTSFFRDPEAWDFLRAEILPAILAVKGAGTPLRVWSAGCASGEEAYSLAMMIAETIGPEDFRRRVKIYATDVDEEGSRRRGRLRTPNARSPACRPSSSTSTSSRTAVGTPSARISAGRSSSAATTWCRTPRSRGSTCWCAATP